MRLTTFILAFFIAYIFTVTAVAQTAVSVDVVSAPATAVVQEAPAAPAVEPVKTVEQIQLTVKDEVFVPPTWLQDALLQAKNIPFIGPYVVMVFQWLGVVVTLLTGLFAFLWAALKSLQVVASAAQLAGLAEKLAMLENSKIMYYLKAFSAFNAQKKDKPS